MSSLPAVFQSCNVSSDCQVIREDGSVINRLCYSEISGVAEENICDCFSWFGFTGEFCDSKTVYSWFYTFFHMLLLLLFVSGCLYSLFCIRIYLVNRANQRWLGKTKQKTGNFYLFVITVLLFCSFIFGSIGGLSAVSLMLDQSKTQLLEVNGVGVDPYEVIVGPFGYFSVMARIISNCFAWLSYVIMMLFWLKVIEQMRIVVEERKLKKIKVLRIATFILSLLVFVGTFILCYLRHFALVALSSIFFSVIILYLTWFARNIFLTTVDMVHEKQSHNVKLTKKIKKFSFYVTVLHLSYCLGCLVIGITRVALGDKSPPGRFNAQATLVGSLALIQGMTAFYSLRFIQIMLGKQLKEGEAAVNNTRLSQFTTSQKRPVSAFTSIHS